MDRTTLEDQQSKTRKRHTVTFDGTDGNIVDAGAGRCFCAYHITTALDASDVTMTFKGSPPTDDDRSGETDAAAAAMESVYNTVQSEVSHTVPGVGYYPLSPVVFHGIRYLQCISDTDIDGKTMILISKPV
jgi:hypothetical protein